MRKTWLLVILGLVAFGAILVYLTLGLRRHRVEVCITFHGNTNCRTAAGSSREEALRTATANACAQLASGMTDSMACEGTPPTSIRWLNPD